MADANAEKEFRFDVRGVLKLARLFELPEYVITSERDKARKTEAVCILLARLSYSNRNYDMMQRFGRCPSALSRLFSHIVFYVYNRSQEIIYLQKRVCAERIQMYCDGVHACGAPMKNAYGFIDGTKIPVCRPSARSGKKENLQKQVYSGHKRVHCMNFQAVVVPDGLAIHCWGPMEGRRHDITMLRESKLADYMADHHDVFNGYIIYGDPAYGIQTFLVSGFKGARVSANEKKFNKMMSSV
ncbi:hypothetical protein PR001_g4824 [Phytophthora rubi]|uniref:DDE Tnp4 domain-containing protein n=1 Tax=Phytophthora rubi TaxID=129364 RepID=A0A6A3NMK4_9STRA|nr:hypothetical protein PR001_g4824 [Phytophthora rubi]